MRENVESISNITKLAIEQTEEFKYIMNRIKTRGMSGYNYVVLDDDIRYRLKKFSINDYLEHLGFTVGMNKIKWEF